MSSNSGDGKQIISANCDQGIWKLDLLTPDGAVRKIDLPLRVDFIGVSSYRNDTKSSKLVFTKELNLDIKGQDVLIVDDILDTGKTLKAVIEKLELMNPKKIRTCVLLSKRSRREHNIPADYIGFEISNEFVVGYGLDHAEQHRNLPYIGVLSH